MRAFVVLLIAATLALACGDDSPTAPGDVSISFENIVQGSYTGFTEPRRVVVHNQGDLARVWQEFHAGGSPVPGLPAVDFSRETVVLVAAGSRSNGCYAIEITGADLAASGTVRLEVTETVPGSACICTEAITRPAHLVRFSRRAAPVTFVEQVVQRAC